MSACAAGKNEMIDRLSKVQLAARTDLKVSRHIFRGEPSYVLHDSVRFTSNRLSPQDYRVLTGLDGKMTLGENFERLVATNQVKKEDEADFYDFIVRLQMMGLLNLPLTSTQALYERFLQQKAAMRGSFVGKLFFLKIPLCNPDAMLERTMPIMRPLFSRFFFFIWLIGITLAGGIIFRRWSEFTEPLGSFLATENLLFLWVTLVGLKVWHELGHGWACKNFGGNVPDMGALLFALTPCAYVDASSAWNFTRTRDRVIVSLGGMYFESIAAIIATFIWAFTGDPMIRSCAQQLIVLSTVTTLLFNANPLMRYDGYYILGDLLGIPNLRARSTAELQGTLKRRLLGIEAPVVGHNFSTRALLLGYGFCSSIYKSTIMIGIAMIIAYRLPFVGLLIGIYYIASLIFGLSVKLCRYLWFHEETEPVRLRAWLVSLCVMIGIPMVLLILPASNGLRVEGVLGAEHEEYVRTEVGGYLEQSHVSPGQTIQPNQSLFTFSNEEVEDQVRVAHSQRQLAKQRWLAVRGVDNTAAAQSLETIRHHDQQVRLASQRQSSLQPTAMIGGRVASCVSNRQPGDYFQIGEPLAIVVGGKPVIRTLVTTEELSSVMPQVGDRVICRLKSANARRIEGSISHITPLGSDQVPHESLTQKGGGQIIVDPNSDRARNPYFEITIALDEDHANADEFIDLALGGTAVVRMSQVYESVGSYFLRKFKIFYSSLAMG